MGPSPINSEQRSKVCPQCKTRYEGDSKICPKDGTILVFETGELPLGTVIADKYQIVEFIGRGSSGSVYRATHAALKREVAIKILKLDFVSDTESMKRFELEAKATSKLSHHNVACVYDHGVLPNGQPYMICEYLKGKTLKDVLQKHKLFQAPDAIEICVQICDAITAAHERGIVHRDIKPANIMLCVDERGQAIVKLIDFGMAKIMAGHKGDHETLGLTQTGDILGTPYYMSPEQALGQKVDWRADIYALGCVLFEMVSGSVPYHGSSEYEVIDKHVYAPVPALPPHIAVGENIPAVIKRSLAKMPDLRYSSAQEMKDGLLGREASSASKASGSMLRSMSAAKDVTTSVKKGGIDQFVPVLILAVLGVIGWYVFTTYSGSFTKGQAVTAPPPQPVPATSTTDTTSSRMQPPLDPHALPPALASIKSMPNLSDQIRFCEEYAGRHPFDYGTEHQLAVLYSNFDDRKSAEHFDKILQQSVNDAHTMQHLAGSQIAASPIVGKVYLANQLKDNSDLAFVHAACLLKMGELQAESGEVRQARDNYRQLALEKNPALAEYVKLANERLMQMESDDTPATNGKGDVTRGSQPTATKANGGATP